MQMLAAEMNLSETAFVRRRPGGGFDLRWFTPAVEVDLCGHATLAAAHALWELGEPARLLVFHTRSGVLVADRTDGLIRLDFPAEPAEPLSTADASLATAVSAALGMEPVWAGRNRLDVLVEAASVDAVTALAPDLAAVAALPALGVIVTAAVLPGEAHGGAPGHRPFDTPVDFVSRYFGPATGIDEDPVTGSAHCALGPHWAARLGRRALLGYQASARGGYVGVEVAGDRVYLSGQAVTVVRGELAF